MLVRQARFRIHRHRGQYGLQRATFALKALPNRRRSNRINSQTFRSCDRHSQHTSSTTALRKHPRQSHPFPQVAALLKHPRQTWTLSKRKSCSLNSSTCRCYTSTPPRLSRNIPHPQNALSGSASRRSANPILLSSTRKDGCSRMPTLQL